jgi:hypothetical protein
MVVAIQENIAAMHEKLTRVIQENELSTKPLVGPERAKLEGDAEQAKHEMIFKLMMKRKELEAADFSAFEINEQLTLPRKDDDEEPSKKRCRRVVKKEEETCAYS